MELTKSQNNVVNELVNATRRRFENPTNHNNIINFKAPTGSGKTFMISNYIDRLISEFGDQKLIFWITTLSAADLSGQFADSIEKYKRDLVNKNMQIELIQSPSTSKAKSKSAIDSNWKIYAQDNTVFVSGISSFGKNRIFTEEGVIEGFLDEIKNQDYKLIYIRDEAHFGGNVKEIEKNSKNRFENQMQDNAFVVLKMTATPSSSHTLIELKEKDLLNDDVVLIKSESVFNQGISKEVIEVDNIEILNIACQQFNNIKKEYSDHDKEPGLVGINPAMLIQVENKTKNNEEEFEKNINEIIKIIEQNNLSWVKYFGDNEKDTNLRMKESFSLKDISKNSSAVDVIIFKIGPATGWNIPRACMLVQLRNVSSATLDKQTLGRIKRNPNPEISPHDLKKSIASKYYVYSNNQPKHNSYESYFLKENYYEEDFVAGYIDEEVKQKPLNNGEYLEIVKTLINKKFSNENYYNAKVEGYKEYFEQKKFIILEANKYGKNNEIINKKAYNSIDLELYIAQLKRQNKNYLISELITFLNEHFSKMLVNNIITKNINLLWLVFFNEILIDIKECHKELLNHYKDKSSFYKIKHNIKLPKQFSLIKDDDPKLNITLGHSMINNFAYLKNKANDYESKLNFEIPLDSIPEKDFVEMIKKKSKDFEEQNIKVWTKNPVHQGVYINYLDDQINTNKAYPDFIIKANDHLIYIEVKSVQDIDKDKTNNINSAFSEYIQELEGSKTKYTFLIARHNNSNRTFDYTGSSTITKLNDKLANNERLDLFNDVLKIN